VACVPPPLQKAGGILSSCSGGSQTMLLNHVLRRVEIQLYGNRSSSEESSALHGSRRQEAQGEAVVARQKRGARRKGCRL